MSSPLAIASVTAVLKDLLINGLIDHDLSPTVGDVKVTALPPDRISTGDQEQSQLNLFLYQATPNAGWRNVGLPSRDGRGQSIASPPLALDLHYLLTAYGAKDFHSEILLGYAMQLFHETPVLARNAIRTALALPSPAGAGGGLPATLQTLSASELADQIEQIKICPQSLSTEETSKLWTALQARYRTTAAYQVSVVLIDSRQPARATLPVLSRGADDRGASAQAGVSLPSIEEVILPHGQSSALLGDTLNIRGQNLDGLVSVRFAHQRFASLEIEAQAAQTLDSRVEVKLDPAVNPEWASGLAGFYTVAAVVNRAGREWSSNELPFSLAPRIEGIAPLSPLVRDGTGKVTLTLTCNPPVKLAKVDDTMMRFDQKVTLLLGLQRQVSPEAPDPPPASSAPAPASTDKLKFVFTVVDAETGEYLLRLRVDGVEMPLVDRSVLPPQFDPKQKVKIT